MSTSSDLKSGDFFSDQHPPPPWPSLPIRPPTPPPHWAISSDKRGSSYQGLQVVEYSSNQTLAYIGVTKKKLSSICLQRTTSITQENEARNNNTSMRSQMILEFWNIWSLNLIFFVGNWSKLCFIWWFLVIRTGERRLPLYPGESRIIRESWHIWKRRII